MAKKWWTRELTKLRHEANRTGRKASKYRNWPEHYSHTERQSAQKLFQRTLEKTKQQHWRDWLEKAEDPDIWAAHRYTVAPAGDGGKSRIPVLKVSKNGLANTAKTNAEKSAMLAQSFFPPKPPSTDPLHFVYPQPVCKLDPLTKEQIKQQLAKLKPYKAPGPDGIPNIILTKCANALVDRLHPIYSAILEFNLYYAPWKQSTTVVLRKPGKPRYDTSNVTTPPMVGSTWPRVRSTLESDCLPTLFQGTVSFRLVMD